MDNIYALARSLAYKYIHESDSLFELIDKLNSAKESEQDMTTRDALAYLTLKVEELDAKSE